MVVPVLGERRGGWSPGDARILPLHEPDGDDMKRSAMKRRLQAPSPAMVISAIALFAALGSGAAFASGLISGNQIVNHSIPAKKLTAAAIKTLHGQRGPAGPGPIAINRELPPGSGDLTPQPLSGVNISYSCDPTKPSIRLALNSTGDQVFYSGDYDADGEATSVTPLNGGANINLSAARTLNLDLLALGGDGSHIWRIDLAGMFVNTPHGLGGCLFWGLVTTSS